MGCGMMGRETGLPTACPACHTLWAADRPDDRRFCRKCGSGLYYLHETGNFEPADVLDRFQVTTPWDLDETEADDIGSIPDVRYRCPACGQTEMALVHKGCWD